MRTFSPDVLMETLYIITYYTFFQLRDWGPLNVEVPGCSPVSTPLICHYQLLINSHTLKHEFTRNSLLISMTLKVVYAPNNKKV